MSENDVIYQPLQIAQGVVISHQRFGTFVRLPHDRLGLIHLPKLLTRDQSDDERPAVGATIEVVVMGDKGVGEEVYLSVLQSDFVRAKEAASGA